MSESEYDKELAAAEESEEKYVTPEGVASAAEGEPVVGNMPAPATPEEVERAGGLPPLQSPDINPDVAAQEEE